MLNQHTPRKRAVNLFVDADLLDEARRIRINISDTLERRLRMIVKAELERRWLEQNREAIEAYNQGSRSMVCSPIMPAAVNDETIRRRGQPFSEGRDRQPSLVARPITA